MPTSPARVPAASMALALLQCSVPRLRYKPLLTAVISATSSHIIGHDRRSAAGKQEIGAIAGRHIIGNAVDQGRLALHLAQQFPQGQRTICRWSLPPFPEFHGRTSS